MRVGNDSLLALPLHKGSEIGSKLQQHIGTTIAHGFREWGHATIVCWHYNGTGVQKIGVGNHNLLTLPCYRGRLYQFVAVSERKSRRVVSHNNSDRW
jgi:hypothetical protein